MREVMSWFYRYFMNKRESNELLDVNILHTLGEMYNSFERHELPKLIEKRCNANIRMSI